MKLTEDKRRHLNHSGVKNSADMWRTFGGEHYNQWTSEFDDNLVKAYRAAGVKCAVRNGELFVRNTDQDRASAVDLALAHARRSLSQNRRTGE